MAMNALDLAIVVAAVGAGVGGWRFGFVARVLAWCGLAAGLLFGVATVPNVVTDFGGTSPEHRVTVALLFLACIATIGHALGLTVSLLVHRAAGASRSLPRWDRAAGAAVGVGGVLCFVWMMIPSLAMAAGWPARLTRDSAVVDVVDEYSPRQPKQFAMVGLAISEAPYPPVLDAVDAIPDPGPPPQTAIAAAIDARVRKSVVKVGGTTCDQRQVGSGFVVSGGSVVTNAHVVAGEHAPEVQDGQGLTHEATVIAFDPVRDLAVVRAPDLDAPGLPLGHGAEGSVGAVYGHPYGAPLETAPAEVVWSFSAVGEDITRTGTSRRDVLLIAAELRHGYSGGPLVDARGEVIGVAFAVDPVHPSASYALASQEVAATLDSVRGESGVSTGDCLIP
jgi:S1-C subfamily serine protease